MKRFVGVSLLCGVTLGGCSHDSTTGSDLDASRQGELRFLISDLDGDGLADAAERDGYSPGRPWGFASPVVAAGTPNFAYAFGDYNGDGVVDRIVNGSGVTVELMTALGTVSETVVLTMPQQLNSSFRVVAVPDLDGDGDDEMLVGLPAYDGDAGVDSGAVLLFLGSPSGPETVAAAVLEGAAASEELGSFIAIGDVNGDGAQDLVTAGDQSNAVVSVFLGTPLGFESVPSMREVTPTFIRQLVVADVDQDGNEDVFSRFGRFVNGYAGVAGTGPQGAATWSYQVDIRELNSFDALMDMGDVSYPLIAFGNRGVGRFTVENDALAFTPYAINGGYNDGLQDVTGDGYNDWLSGGRLVAGTAQGVGAPVVDNPPTLPDLQYVRSVHDIDGDGRNDAIILNDAYLASGDVQVLPDGFVGVLGDPDNNGLPSLLFNHPVSGQHVVEYSPSLALTPDTAVTVGQRIVGDIDGDGLSDTYSGATLTFTRLGDTAPPTFTSNWVSYFLDAGDINGDGVDDAVGASDGFVSVWFGGSTTLNADAPDIRASLDGLVYAAGDLNGDGLGDVWVRGVGGEYDLDGLHAFYGGPTGFRASDITVPMFQDSFWLWRPIEVPGWDRSALMFLGRTTGDANWIVHITDDNDLAASLYYVGDRAVSQGNDAVDLTDLVDDGYPEMVARNTDLIRLVDADGDRFFEGSDCDDNDPTARPVLRWADEDGDGFGDATRPALTCGPAPFTADRIGDCDDTRADVFPGAPEQCFVDSDCDGRMNESDPDTQAPTWALDADGDGFAGTDRLVVTCYDPGEFRLPNAGTDCDDTSADVFPGAEEVCDGVDQDCNGLVDDGPEGPAARYRDVDGDGYGTELLFVCEQSDQHATVPGDCGPTDATIHPGATEIWYDGIDQDCDNNDTDQDRDGVARGPDCDDTDASISPVATELWYDGIDQDCDGNDDDRDGDGIPVGEDCNDLVPTPCPDQLGAARSACSSVPGSVAPFGVLALVGLLMRRRRTLVATVALAGCATAPELESSPPAERGNIPEMGPVCDYDGDGILDVVRAFPWLSLNAPEGGRVEVGLLNEDGSERDVVALGGDLPQTKLGTSVVCAGDMDGDGTDDLVFGSRVHGDSGAALVFRGSPAGPTTTPEVFLADGLPVGAKVFSGDVNADDLPDIVLWDGDSSTAFTAFLGNGTSLDPAPTQRVSPMSATLATVADVDGDGADDLVVSRFQTNPAVTFAGSPSGLATTPTYTSDPIDNVRDMVTYRSKTTGRDTVLVIGIASAVVRPEQPSGLEFVYADFSTLRGLEDLNSDGYVDLPSQSQTPSWGTAQGPQRLPIVQEARLTVGMAIDRAVDVDGDGLRDAVSDNPPSVVLSSGGTWLPPAVVVGALGDADGDGVPDLAMTRLEEGVWRWYVAEYAADLTLNPAARRWGQIDSVLGDIDGDGVREFRLNFATVGYLSPLTGASIWNSPAFTSVRSAGDIDGDGLDDLLGQAADNQGLWFGVEGDLALAPDTTLASGFLPAGDANADGFADLWQVQRTNQVGASRIRLFLGSASGLSEEAVDEIVFNDAPRQLVDVGSDRAVTMGADSAVLFGFDGTHITLVSTANHSRYSIAHGVGIQLTPDGVAGVPGRGAYLARFEDADGDGSFRGTDCDDDDPTVVPRLAWWDADGDGAGDVERPIMTCTELDVVADNSGDCADDDGSIHPNAAERCNGIDDDCDGMVDNDPENPPQYYQDLDGDGVGGATVVGACQPPGATWVRSGGDCDDTNPSRSPGVVERCNGVDDDCNGWVDDSLDGDAAGFLDADQDGYGTTPVTACTSDVPWLAQQSGDCGPHNPEQYPGAPEVWYDGIDQSCDGNDTDQDGDGVPLGADCDDTNDAVSPRSPEVWYDGVDQDCDGNDTDQDADGVDGTDDCDDQNPTAFPGAVEIWYDGVDQDCDGNDLDQDGDGLSVIDDCDDTDADNVDVCDNAPGCAVVPAPSGMLLVLALVGIRRRRRTGR